MLRLIRFWPLAAALCLFAADAEARKPADVFKGKIIMSTKPFPARFGSDRRFVSHMRKVDTDTFTYADEAESLNIEFMAFFRRAYGGTEFPAMVYDITEGRRKVATFPIYPDPTQKSTRILASYARLTKDQFPDESRKYEMVITSGGKIIAKTKFSIKESAAARAARIAEEKAIKKGSVVTF